MLLGDERRSGRDRPERLLRSPRAADSPSCPDVSWSSRLHVALRLGRGELARTWAAALFFVRNMVNLPRPYRGTTGLFPWRSSSICFGLSCWHVRHPGYGYKLRPRFWLRPSSGDLWHFIGCGAQGDPATPDSMRAAPRFLIGCGLALARNDEGGLPFLAEQSDAVLLDPGAADRCDHPVRSNRTRLPVRLPQASRSSSTIRSIIPEDGRAHSISRRLSGSGGFLTASTFWQQICLFPSRRRSDGSATSRRIFHRHAGDVLRHLSYYLIEQPFARIRKRLPAGPLKSEMLRQGWPTSATI